MDKNKEKKVASLVMEEGVMPIVGFYGPYRHTDTTRGVDYDLMTDDVYQKLKECGVNFINYTSHDYALEKEQKNVHDALAYAEKYGIYMFVTDERMHFDITEEEILQSLKDYSHYKSFKGIHVQDEPYNDSEWARRVDPDVKRPTISMLAPLATKLNSMENVIGFSNLNPFREWIGIENYDAYLAEYIENCHPKVLSFDYYVFDPHYSVSYPGYFINLSLIRKNALKYNLPFWAFIQAGSYWNDGQAQLEPTPNDKPTKWQLLWNVNTSLAYGAKGIEYFPVIQPHWFSWQENNTNDYQRNALIGANGEPTQWYEYAKEANKQIAAVDEVLLQAESKEILAVGTVAQAESGCTMKSFGVLESAETKNKSWGAIIGCFDYCGKDAFYVVNHKHFHYGYDDTEEVTLSFKGTQKYRIISEQLSEEIPMSGEAENCTLKLIEGGAALVVME